MKAGYCWTEGSFLVVLEDGRWTSAILHSVVGREAIEAPEKVALRLGKELLSKPRSNTKGIVSSVNNTTFAQAFSNLSGFVSV